MSDEEARAIKLAAEQYYTNAAFAKACYPEAVAQDSYLNGLVAQLDDINAAILRRLIDLRPTR